MRFVRRAGPLVFLDDTREEAEEEEGPWSRGRADNQSLSTPAGSVDLLFMEDISGLLSTLICMSPFSSSSLNTSLSRTDVSWTSLVLPTVWRMLRDRGCG